jgi:hypothetical protein
MFHWRNLIKAALIIAILDGALRKWFFPGFANVLYFLKDFVLIAAYFQFFFLENIHPKIPRELRNVVPLFIMVVAFISLQALNPALGSPIAGLMGMRNYFIYAPLVLLMPHVFRTEKELFDYLRFFVLLMIPVGILGFFQYVSPPTSFLNRYVGEAEAGSNVVRFGEGRARITGTFSYIGGYAAHLTLMFVLLIPLLLSTPRGTRTRELLLLALGLTLANMMMTGSRGPVFGSVMFTVLFFGILIIHFPIDFAKYTPRLAMLGLVGIIAISQSSALKAFQDRATRGGASQDTRMNPFYWARAYTDLFRYGNDGGWGTGSMHQATNALRDFLNLPRGALTPALEDEPDRILAEQGPVGFVLWYLLRLTLLYILWKVYRHLKKPALRNLALAAFIYTGLLFINQMVFHHTNGIYYWFMTGMLAVLPAIQRSEDDRLRRLKLAILLTSFKNQEEEAGEEEEPIAALAT